MKTLIFLLFFSFTLIAQDSKLPIIDMHMHCYTSADYFTAPDMYSKMSPENTDDHFKQCYSLMKKYNIVKGIISGTLSALNEWNSKDVNKRFINGLLVLKPDKITPTQLEELIKEKKIKVYGEIGAVYKGLALNNPEFEPYLKICEQYDIPVAIHTGGGPPEISYDECCPDYRLALGDPFLIEDVLVKHPKLRIYLMHSGEIFYEHAIRLMLAYPQLYSDLGVILWVHPLVKSYAKDFLKRAKEAGLLKRVMFGSDQMVWPNGIEMSIEYLNSMDFLTEKEKRDIFYNNAARFLRLKDFE